MDHPEAGADDDSGMSTYDQDVDLMDEVLGDAPGSELVGVARRFVTAMRRTRASARPVAER